MGRHSLPARWHFARSVIVWAAPWLAAAAVVTAIVWLASTTLGEDGARSASAEGATAPGGGNNRAGPATAAPSSPQPASPKPTRPKPSPSFSPRSHGRQPLITQGVTVQVLDATGGGAAAEGWAHRLTKLGFDIVSVQPGLGPYPATTVYWSAPRDRAAARALAARFGWTTGPRPGSLSPAVSVHLVLGDDES